MKLNKLCFTFLLILVELRIQRTLCKALLRSSIIKESSDFGMNVKQEELASRELRATLTEKGNNKKPKSAFPLEKCEGDCDSDSECQEGLKCFQRDDYSPIPGCDGSGRRGIDYCYDPQDSKPNNQPNTESTTNNWPELSLEGNNGKPSSAFPLGRCQGDCDRDGDCVGHFECFKRSSGSTTPVPGCQGTGIPGADYCYDPHYTTETKTSDTNPQTTFRLKLYWEHGYFWQEETVERKWCIECEDQFCKDGDHVELQDCYKDNTQFEFLPSENPAEAQIRIKDRDLCLALDGRRAVRARQCNASDDTQIWWTHHRGAFDGDKFEIHPVTTDGCLTQHHHPKAGEVIFVDSDCILARRWETSYATETISCIVGSE